MKKQKEIKGYQPDSVEKIGTPPTSGSGVSSIGPVMTIHIDTEEVVKRILEEILLYKKEYKYDPGPDRYIMILSESNDGCAGTYLGPYTKNQLESSHMTPNDKIYRIFKCNP